jgi:hypothetical protein
MLIRMKVSGVVGVEEARWNTPEVNLEYPCSADSSHHNSRVDAR